MQNINPLLKILFIKGFVLMIVMANSNTAVVINARVILDFVNGTQRYLPAYSFIMPNGDVRRAELQEKNEHHSFLKAYPNPFEENTTIEINLQEESEDSFLLISDITGKIIYKYPVTQKSMRLLIQMNNISKGIYLATLFNKGAPVDVVKLIAY
ncbi:MAG: T9SS type A sorting domain-containing protein [Bacteroidota bacterium]